MSKIKRKPAKIKKEESSVLSEFDSIVSPQQRIKPGFDYKLLPKNVTDDQVYALQEKNFALWVISSGLKVDHHPFDFDNHKYMIPLYMDQSKELILMKSAQMGATIYELCELLHFTLFNEAVKACLFFPTGDGVIKLSRDRMTPLIASNRQLAEAVEDTDTLGYKRIGANSALYLQHLGGIASKDSTPFDMISFDEVRLLNPADIDQARERVSHSSHKKVRMVSTAGLPNCLSGDTKIQCRHKETKRKYNLSFIELNNYYCIDDYEVLSVKYGKPYYAKINGIIKRGYRKVVNVCFEGGNNVICTSDHRFYTPTDSTLKNVKYLSDINFTSIKDCWNEDLKVTKIVGKNLISTHINGFDSFEDTEVYDIEVEGTPWFVLENGCLVHNSDIHRQFLRGTQNYWYSFCGCAQGCILSDVFPECIVERKGETYYRCPRCGYRILDPQNGQYISHNPGAPVQSYHISQMLSHFISPAEILEAYRTTQNIKEFFNAKLGKPYVDEKNIPVTQDDLDSSVNTDCSWGPDKGQIAMGIDQMGGNNYVVIVKRLPNGKKRIIHLEIIDRNNSIYFKDGEPEKGQPFKRCYDLMKEYKVDMCICDALPNYNDAKDLAQAFPRKVFLAQYMEGQKDIVQWGDRAAFKQQVKKGSHKIKFKQTVVLSRYLSIEFAMKEVSGGAYEWPHPRALVQIARNEDTGKFGPQFLMEEVFYTHMKSIVKQKEITNDETGQFKMLWVNLGLDPHMVHSLNYCNIAVERLRSIPIFSVG